MSWNENSHADLRGQHALFSPSQPAWLNYDSDTFKEKLSNKYKASIGTEIHEWCAVQIALGNKVASKKELLKGIKTHIYEKYYSTKYGLSDFGNKLLKNLKNIPYNTIISYVNDSVSLKLEPEVLVAYTDNFFGTADALKFNGNLLMVSDLKTGTGQSYIEQLLIYDALYCLANKLDPYKIDHELRMYKGDDVTLAKPEGEDVQIVMDKIIFFDKIMTKFEGGNSYE